MVSNRTLGGVEALAFSSAIGFCAVVVTLRHIIKRGGVLRVHLVEEWVEEAQWLAILHQCEIDEATGNTSPHRATCTGTTNALKLTVEINKIPIT